MQHGTTMKQHAARYNNETTCSTVQQWNNMQHGTTVEQHAARYNMQHGTTVNIYTYMFLFLFIYFTGFRLTPLAVVL